jgi:signal transduction histidine kinase/integral membrane sensor domain MASE1
MNTARPHSAAPTTPHEWPFRRYLLAALAYFLLGLGGLALAIPPGYASPIFPAAGFAVALMLWSDRRAWPGIAIGSLLLNLHTGDLSEAMRFTTVLAALGIAAGATLQAYAAAWLVNRVAGQDWQTMERDGGIARILALAGPLACLISASAGTGTLVLGGIVPPADAMFTWWSWWIGDTLGVLVALPLSLAVVLRAQSIWRSRLAYTGLPMIVALGVIAAAYVAVSHWERARQDSAVQEHGEQLAQLLTQRFIAHQEALAALKRLIEVTPDMNYAQFEHFTRITLRDNPDFFALSFNPFVRQHERAAFERRMAVAAQKADFEIKEPDPQKRLVRAGERAEYVTVGYIAPLEGNQPAVGYDINSEPVRQDAIRRARESRQLSVTSTIRLVQENQERVGALLLNPAYDTRLAGAATAEEGGLIGFAVGVLKLDQMVDIATRSARVPGLAFSIEDITAGKPARVFGTEAGTPSRQAAVWTIRLAMADRAWELTVYPTPAYRPANRPWMAWATGIAGIILAALLQVLLLVTSGHAAAAERTVSEQGEVLRKQGADLKDRSALIDTLFEVSPDGFVAFAQDDTILFANPAFHRLTGLPADAVIGRTMGDLDERLRRQSEQPERHVPLYRLFAADGDEATRQTLNLVQPREAVLQVTGVRGIGARIDRFAYFRDVTHEAEVDRMKSEFLSHAAHELRTPMASIFGFTDLLMSREFDAATRNELLATIHRQTVWLVDIINELLDLARIEARRGKDFTFEAVHPCAIVRDAVASLQVDSSRWPIVEECQPSLPPINADAGKLRQALNNVLGNAVKYSPDGGAIEIRSTARDADGGTQVGISVTDHGIGMTPEEVGHVSERFWRADTSGNIPGTGLGMAIVKEIVELHGGSVEVQSRPGLGTSITLWLPAGAADGQRLES